MAAEKKPAAKRAAAKAAPAAADEAPAGPRSAYTLEDASKVGFFGVEADTAPNHVNTVAGVTGKEPNA